ncbi:unnamed protein product [Mytilus coruscus]|uniref:SWIM-type domain-containing protein n=1 Tax=Mytilus coruscus TaxID=42192 RepID=A0A6J8EF28_MYTCO|nr:unnamed protein product [Mytilus coruscus]
MMKTVDVVKEISSTYQFDIRILRARTFRQHCQSSISFLLSCDGHYLELKSINNEHNHDTSEALFKQLPRERRLPKEMTEEAESLISLKVNKKLLRDHLEQKTGKKVSLKDITNLQTVIKNRSKCHDVASLVKKLLIDHGTIVELFASEDNVLQGLFYQDKEMLQNFENYPEILFIDSTFKVNNLRMPLYVFLVEDSMGQSEVAGLCFLAAEEQQLVDHMGNLFKKFNPSYQKMKMIMTDKDFIERETFRSVFPHSSLLISRFHVLKIFRREITVEKMGITSSQRNAALELIQKLVYSRTEEDYEEVYKEIEEMCPSAVIGYIKSNWHGIRKEWVSGMQLDEGTFLNATNNRLESFNQKLKSVVCTNATLDDFFDKFRPLIRTLRNERDHAGAVELQKARVCQFKYGSPEKKYITYLTDYAAKFVLINIKKCQKMQISTEEDTGILYYEDSYGKIVLNDKKCSCIFNRSMSLPCEHILVTRLFLGLDLFDASVCSMRWTLSYYRQKMSLLTTDKSVEGHVICSTVKEKNGPLSEYQKYRKASVITNQLASHTSVSEDILSGCDQPGFANRTADNSTPDNSTPISANVLHEQDNHEADPIYSRKDGQYAGKSTNSTTVILQGQTDPICRPSTKFLFKIADKAAVIRAERGSSKIDEDEVQVVWQELIPYAELILNLTTQAHAKQYFTYEGWLTVESTIRILEEEEFEKILINTQNMEKEIKDFIIRGGHTKSLPKIGNPVSAVEDYIDKTRKLTEEQRTILATFLCNSYKEISYRTPDVASLIHNIITFVLEFNETDIAEERIHLEVDTENIRKTCSSDDGTENLEPIGKYCKNAEISMCLVSNNFKALTSSIHQSYPGTQKAVRKPVIGVKEIKETSPSGGFKKCSVIKELAILQWILGDEKGRTVFDDKEKVFQNEVQNLAFFKFY